MYKLLFYSFFFTFLLFSCQNTPKTPGDATPAVQDQSVQAPAPTPPTPESLEQAKNSLTEGIQLIETVRKQVDELPAGVKKQKANEMEAIYSTLEGILEKQTMMLNEMQPSVVEKGEQQFSDSPGIENLTTEVVKDYQESAVRYAEDVKRIQVILEQWKNAPK